MIKLIASDLDGTLLLHGAQQLNPEVYDLILKLKKQGIHFVAASGRQYASLRNLFKPIADEISYIAENGAVCIHNGELISLSEMDRDLVLRIANCVKERPNCNPLISCLDTCYIESGDDEYLYHIRHFLKNRTSIVDSFTSVKEPFLKIAFRDTENPVQSTKYFQEKFQDEVNVVTAGNGWIDFIPFGLNKGTALKKLLDKLEIVPEDTISFGDQQNDIEMLMLTGKSYAMATAKPDVMQHADEVTDSVEKILRQFINE